MSEGFEFLLGVEDPEMREIISILDTVGWRYRRATHQGKPVNPATAYKADLPTALPDGVTVVFVECNVPTLPEFIPRVRIDHHQPGDHGYALDYTRFWEAASIGQLVKFAEEKLGREKFLALFGNDPERQERLVARWKHVAALDHCLGDAYSGRCPGIDVALLREIQLENIARGTGSSLEQVRDAKTELSNIYMKCPIVSIEKDSPANIRDCTAIRLCPGYSLQYLLLKELAIESGEGYLALTRDDQNGPLKVVLGGKLEPDVIQQFLNRVTANHPFSLSGVSQPVLLARPYGVPMRGYAGAYLPDDH